MSDIRHIQEASQSLEFLNGEIAKAETRIGDLSVEVERLLKDKKDVAIALHFDRQEKALAIQKLDDQIGTKTAELDTLGQTIATTKIELDALVSESLTQTEKNAGLKGSLDEQARLLSDKAESLETKARSLSQETSMLDEEKRKLESAKVGLEKREARLQALEEAASRTALSQTKAEDEILAKRNEAEALFRENALRATELDRERDALEARKRDFEAERIDTENKAKDIVLGKATLAERTREVEKQEEDLEKQKTFVAKRETNVILKEEDLKVREKRIRIAEEARSL